VRIYDLMVDAHLRSGRLVPVLTDWQMADAPPFNLLYAPNQRRNPRARLFIDYVTDAFRELETESSHDTKRRQFNDRPYWARGKYRRASAAVRRKERGMNARKTQSQPSTGIDRQRFGRNETLSHVGGVSN